MRVEGGYPVHWEADVVLRDGATTHMRPIRPADADLLQAFHVGQSERSTYLRFFAPMARLSPSDLERFTTVDHRDRVALVAVSGQEETERILAVGRFDRAGAATAEVAFNVADTEHGRGIGSVLLEHLAAAARERGIARFTADVLPQNAAMLAIFREAGYAISQRLDDGVITVVLDIDPTQRSRAVMADREHRAEARSVEALLTARRVLVVAEAEPGPVPSAGDPLTLAAAVLSRLGATGAEVHVVAPATVPAPGATRHDAVDQVPPVDLLVLAVPAERAGPLVRAAAPLGPRSVVVLTGGFAETGPEGVERQRALVRTVHAVGMRLLGPASYGLWRRPEGAPALDVSLALGTPAPGRLALMCQSAPMAVGLLTSAERRGLGLATFVSSGNRADLSGNDVMQFSAADPATQVVGLYLESIGNPRKFARVVRRLAGTKPVVIFTAGRTGHVVPAGHALPSTKVPRRVLDDLLRRSGAIRVTSQHQLLDVCQLLVAQPLPRGSRVAVLASSESLGTVVAEAAASAGLEVVRSDILPASDDEVRVEIARPGADVLVLVDLPTTGTVPAERLRAVAEAAAASGRTTLACVLGSSGLTTGLTAPGPDGTPVTVPAFTTPEDTVAALAPAARYAAWRAQDHGTVADPTGLDRDAARSQVEAALADGPADGSPRPMPAAWVAELLAHYGLRVWPTRPVATVTEAVQAAEELGWPVALKSTALNLRHRIDLGAVRLDLADEAALREAWALLHDRLGPAGAGHLPLEVQAMASAGIACVVRSTEDARFGPVVAFGLAGDAVELLDDLAYGVAPLTVPDVSAMIREVRAAPRLFGYRGTPEVDVAALEDLVARIGALADDLPEVRRLELHPVVVGPRGLAVLGASLDLAPTTGRSDGPRRTLPR